MKNNILLFIILLITNLCAQEYFQQEVNYNINVTLNDQEHTLNGHIDIEYINNSNEPLDILWFHLWPNAYKNNSTALAQQKLEEGDTDFYYANKPERGYIDNIAFKVDDKLVQWEYHPEHIDICKLMLSNTLNPGDTIKISTPFLVKIPDGKFSRLGHVQQSYMITQWYPKPAVYDKEGWHIMPYLNQGEFYSEFGNFDVTITLPNNYIVGATGNLQTESEIAYLNALAKKTESISDFGNDISFPKSNLKTKTIQYTEQNVHDFGWFADKRFNVLKGEVQLPHSKDTVTLWSMFTNNEADLWKKSIEYMHDATYYYSLWNGDYPYKQATAVDGTISAGGGMEYPGVTVIGESGSDKALEVVIMHEIGHNWFYGILGTNERSHPWMDEGINSHNEIRYMRTKYPDYNFIFDMLPKQIIKLLDLQDYDYKQTILELNMMLSRIGQDQPIELHSEEYTTMNYGLIVYMKTAIVLDYLMAYLGEDTYDECMQLYFEKWKFKHPGPKDLQLIFEEKTGKNLEWFFKDMLQTTKHIDYAITNIKENRDNFIVTIKNKGEISSPIVISSINNGKNYNPIWIDGFANTKEIEYPKSNIDHDYIQIDFDGHIPETNRNNNIIKTNGLFKKTEPFKFQLMGSIDHPNKTQIFFLPSYEWNYYDKSLLGVKLYNRIAASNGFSYTLSPLYSIHQNSLAGNMKLGYEKYYPTTFIQKIKTGLLFERYSYEHNTNNNNFSREYSIIEPFVEIVFKKNHPRSKTKKTLKTDFLHLNKGYETLNFVNTEYKFTDNRTINPYFINTKLEFGKDLKKASVIMQYKYQINKKRHLHIRGYLGFVNSSNKDYYLNMSGWNGIDDYSFSNRFLGRSETDGFFSQQIIAREGFIKHETNITSDQILTSINLDFNATKIVKLYTEFGTNGSDSAYGIGLRIPLGPINIYMPLFTEQGFEQFENFRFIRYNFSLDMSNFSFFSL